MKMNVLSSFAAGILMTTTICGAVYFTDKKDVPNVSAKSAENNTIVKAEPTENEMIQLLQSKGYVVLAKTEYDKNINDAKASAQKQDSPEDNKSAKNVTKVILNVSDGMTSINVGNMLVQAGLIENAFNFSKEIESRGLENKLRPGTFVVDSEMSYDQIIATIFK